MKYFSEAIIKFEALTMTPLKSTFEHVSLDKQLELLEVVIADIKEFAAINKLEYPTRKTWDTYRKATDWQELSDKVLIEPSLIERARTKLVNISLFS